MYIKKLFSYIILFVIMVGNAKAQENPYSIRVGVRLQRAVGFYWANGITLEYNSQKILKRKLDFGFNYVTSSLGTAAFSKAIPYSEVNVSAIKYFRNQKHIKPIARLNIGYAHANFGSEIYKDLPNSSMLLSFETGAAYDFKQPIRMALTGGYNFIYGDGTSGLGVIYPMYLQFSVLYSIK